jgi:hypothetical protein
VGFDTGTLTLGITFVLFLGAAAVFLRGSKDKGTIASLSASNASLWEKVRLSDDETKALKTRVDVLEATKQALTEAVTQAARVQALHETVQSIQKRNEENHATTRAMVQQLLDRPKEAAM